MLRVFAVDGGSVKNMCYSRSVGYSCLLVHQPSAENSNVITFKDLKREISIENCPPQPLFILFML